MGTRAAREGFAGALALAFALALFLCPGASAQTVNAHSSDGQTCRLHSIANRDYEPVPPPYAKMIWGIRVSTCNAVVGAQGTLTANVPLQPSDTMLFVRAPAPYHRKREFHGERAFGYQTQINVRVRRRRGHWLNPGGPCSVSTQLNPGDTLNCQLGDFMGAD